MANLYCIYLRKSRADIESERNGIDSLERHKKTLLALSDSMKLKIGKIYHEVVSGDTIAARPQMQSLLQDVEAGMWEGVLVMEVERLARGATIDQGIIAQVFKFSNTKIITPLKTYNPNDEYDEEFFEYGLFQSRREYKAITRRQQRGILASVQEGKWVYNKTPFGYERYKLQNEKGYSLIIIPDQAETIRMIFDLYANQNMGYSAIAEKLNELQVQGPGEKWTYNTICSILQNPVYIGKVRRGARATSKTTENGSLKVSRPRNKDYKIYDGLHEAIIDEVTYKKVQDRFATHKSKPVGKACEIKNPLASLVYCAKCGHVMIRRPQDRCKTMIICPTKGCTNVSSYEHILEQATIDYLEGYLARLKVENNQYIDLSTINVLKANLSKIESELTLLNKQLDNAYDLVEQGIYSPDLFLQRSEQINQKIKDATFRKNEMHKKIKKENKILENKNKIIPKLENALAIYWGLSPAEKNSLLSEIIERIDYEKNERSKRGEYLNFHITVTPRISL